jgi:hypothetical protein
MTLDGKLREQSDSIHELYNSETLFSHLGIKISLALQKL